MPTISANRPFEKRLRICLLVACAVCALAAVALSGCQKQEEVPNTVVEHVETQANTTTTSGSTTSNASTTSKGSTTSAGTSTVAYVTESGAVDTNGFNSGIWSGVQAFAQANSGWSAKNYSPADDDASRSAAVKQAVADGANVVVVSGSAYATLLPEIAKADAKVQFLLVDSSMTDATGAAVTASNVSCITYKEQEAGYLLGYALVKEGYKGLGFCGGKAVPAVVRYGYGFVQGVQAATIENGNAAETYMAYWYTDTFAANDGVQAEVSRWYDNGVDVVFSCGGGIFDNVLASATEKNKPLCGCDIDQGAASGLVVGSAVKNLKGSVSDALSALAKNGGTWDSARAGKTVDLGVAEGGVGLATDSWRFANFTIDDYNALVARIKSGEIVVAGDTGTIPAAGFQLDIKPVGIAG